MDKDPGWQYLRLAPDILLKEQSRPYDTKKNCWVPDQEEGYVAAEITSTKGDQVTVKIASGEKTVKKRINSRNESTKI